MKKHFRVKEQEIYIKELMVMQRKINEAIDVGFNIVFDVFKDAVNQVELLCLDTQVPRSKLEQKKVICDRSITGDGEDHI